jgi:hypothetical protein
MRTRDPESSRYLNLGDGWELPRGMGEENGTEDLVQL